MATEDEDELGQVYQDIHPSLTEKDEREFFPWHKPRKHYLRLFQWCAEVRALIKQNNYLLVRDPEYKSIFGCRMALELREPSKSAGGGDAC